MSRVYGCNACVLEDQLPFGPCPSVKRSSHLSRDLINDIGSVWVAFWYSSVQVPGPLTHREAGVNP
jgi:hypothetical protein